MGKKRLILFLLALDLLISSFIFIACAPEVPQNPVVTGSSVLINKLYKDSDGDVAVLLPVNASNSFIQDCRTVMPDNPSLYFSVTASTLCDANDDADYTSDAVLVSGAHVVNPYYGEELNFTTGMKLSFKVGKSYYLTCYGTSTKPSELGLGSHCGDSIYTNYSAAQKSGVGLASSATNVETYYKYRELLLDQINDNAVVKGTLKIYVDYDSVADAVILRADDSHGDQINVLIIPVSAHNVSGLGQPVFLLNLPATYRTEDGSTAEEKAAKKLTDQNLWLKTIKVTWTAKNSGISGCFVFSLDSWKSTGQFVEFKPYVAVGDYDVDVEFFNDKDKDVFAFHDTLVVWKNLKSKISGSGAYCSAGVNNLNFSDVSVCDALDVDKAQAQIEDGIQHLWTGGGLYSTGVNASKAYVFTAEDVLKYQRTVFYVSGKGDGKLVAATGERNGSLFAPFVSVKEALNVIAAKRSSGNDDGTVDWNIVVDGEEVSAEDIVYVNTLNTPMNLTIRNFSGRRAELKENISFINKSSSADVNLFLNNVDWTGSSEVSAEFGCNVYLSDSTFKDGNVKLFVAKNGETADGTLFMDASDSFSSVSNISVVDNNTVSNYGIGKTVVSFRYHSVNDSNVSSIPFTEEGDYLTRFTIDSIYATADSKNKKFIIDTAAGSYGCIVVAQTE